MFKEKFSNWPDKLPIATQAAVIKGRVANINKDDKVDIQKMHEYKPPAPRVVEGTDPKLKSTLNYFNFRCTLINNHNSLGD